jgi:phage-related protein
VTGWKVELLAVASAEIEAMPADIQARFQRIVALMEGNGPDAIREPFVKHIEGKLWEMRMTGRDGIARAIYITATGRRVIVLRAFVKKTEKTPRREIELALRRSAALS